MLVLVSDEPGGFALRRLRLGHRLMARIRAASLDEALAGGAAPEDNAYLAARAVRLTSARSRRDLAAGLRLVQAGGPRPPAGVPIRPAQVARAAAELEAIAGRG